MRLLYVVVGGGMSRGGMRGRGGGMSSRGGGMRGSRGGMMRGGASGAVTAETLYEDVYEPANQSYNSAASAGFENGSSSVNQSSYFEEFPEPGAADQSMMGSNYRQTQGKLVRMSNNARASSALNQQVGGAATGGAPAAANPTVQQQKAY